MFLLVALGMACGVGLLEVAGLGTIFICLVLVVLDHFGDSKMRMMTLTIVSDTKDYPAEHVTRILESTVDYYEVREMQHNNETNDQIHGELHTLHADCLDHTAAYGQRYGRCEGCLLGGSAEEIWLGRENMRQILPSALGLLLACGLCAWGQEQSAPPVDPGQPAAADRQAQSLEPAKPAAPVKPVHKGFRFEFKNHPSLRAGDWFRADLRLKFQHDFRTFDPEVTTDEG